MSCICVVGLFLCFGKCQLMQPYIINVVGTAVCCSTMIQWGQYYQFLCLPVISFSLEFDPLIKIGLFSKLLQRYQSLLQLKEVVSKTFSPLGLLLCTVSRPKQALGNKGLHLLFLCRNVCRSECRNNGTKRRACDLWKLRIWLIPADDSVGLDTTGWNQPSLTCSAPQK